MGKYFSFILIVGLLTCLSCSDEVELGDGDYLVFGQYGAYCGGETCVEFYRLESDRIFEETSDQYTGEGFHPFNNFVELPETAVSIAKELETLFPTRLLVEPDTILGETNVIDAGYLYVEWKSETQHRYWIISNSSPNLLPEYRTFATEISNVINELN